MATLHQASASKEHRRITPAPHFDYETYYKHQEQQPDHSNALLQYLSETELKYRNDNLYQSEAYRLPRRTDILNRYITMNPNFEQLNRVYEPNWTNIEKQRYRRCVEQQNQKLHRIQKKFDFQTADGHTSHYFLTGARYNRFDTVDSKILLKYGTFINRNNPEQVDIKASHFKKFREILQSQHRSSSGGMDSSRRETGDYDLSHHRNQEEDLDDLTSRFERSSSRQSNLKPGLPHGKRNRLPKLKDPAKYVDVASQMPERRRGRRSLDRAISSSSTHRSNRHRRHSQHQAQVASQQSPAQPSSVSYVANKVSFSLVNESNPVTTTVTSNKKQIDDEYGLTVNEDRDEQEQEHQHQHHVIPGESLDEDDDDDVDDDDDEKEETKSQPEEENPIVIAQIREHANAVVSNILSSAMDQINMNANDA